MGEQRKQVATSEQALQRYREQTDAVSLEDKQNIVVQKRSLSNTFIQQQKGELADLQRQQAQLSDKLGPNHPDMVKLSSAIRAAESRIQGEIAKVVQSMRNDYQQTQAQEHLALFGGATLAIGLAFFFEHLDSSIKSPDEMKRHLGLSFLGMVPALFDKAIENPLINNGVPPNFSESFRAVRTNLLFSSAEEGARSVVVTSTGPGEGKTVVAANLAVALAQAGQRVLPTRTAPRRRTPCNSEPDASPTRDTNSRLTMLNL